MRNRKPPVLRLGLLNLVWGTVGGFIRGDAFIGGGGGGGGGGGYSCIRLDSV